MTSLYGALEDHESSKIHEDVAKSYLLACKNVDVRYVGTLLRNGAMQKRQSDIDLKRKVVKRLIDILVFIGRQGLTYCEAEEAAPDMDRANVN